MAGAALQFWTELLQLTDFVVAHFQEESAARCYRFTVVAKHRAGVCPHCGKVGEKVHQTRTRERIRDLPISHYTVELAVRVAQFECERCRKCFTPAVPFLAEGAHATERFLERAAELIGSSDIANAAGFLSVPERTLADWYYDFLKRRQNRDGQTLKPIRRIGIDELSLKKNIASTLP